MPKVADGHFDIAALVAAVYEQPIGLRIVTNHPEGFRRLVYLHLRKLGPAAPRLHIMQCPKATSAFLLIRSDFQLEEQTQ